MTLLSLVALAVLSAAGSPDPGQPVKDCGRFASQYRALLQRQAESDAAQGSGAGEEAPTVAREVGARGAAAQLASDLRDEVTAACIEANGSQYECVMSAATYEDLRSCALRPLPVLSSEERRAEPAPAPEGPSPTPEGRAAADEQVVREFVRSGKIDLEALGTGSAAQGP